LATDNPRLDIFHGTKRFLEPESQKVAWVLDQFPRIRWHVEINLALGNMLYTRGDDNNQASDHQQDFRNPVRDGKRGIVGREDCREWITETDWANLRDAANRSTTSMSSVGGRAYKPAQSVGLYPTSGASDDYAFS
jgi:murein tripeptide amidase MpaA